MTIKLDENLPERLVAELQTLGHDVDTVVLERLAGRDDADVWQAAQNAGRFFITQDLDFSDVRRYSPGTHAGLLLVRLVQPGRDGSPLRGSRGAINRSIGRDGSAARSTYGDKTGGIPPTTQRL